ncbi:TrmH family RNA methyltransferase [Zoogloea dura]|uniref:RNA methyltransferase n=1 Tax=Zoogloea dura TaxID=2728840 RepID=A0A848G237_9RHOO|nr:RNA methyltransferase [Zoogloea dura]NML25354.1 RNA methyltransferase [Zoogloea dura]
MKHISSRDNPAIKHLQALAGSARDRRKAGETLLDGTHLLEVALQHGVAPLQVVVSESGRLQPEIESLLARCTPDSLVEVPDRLFAQISPVDSPSGVLARVEIPDSPAAPVQGNCVVLDAVQDPGNLGTILRTAAAVGLRDVVLTPGCAQAWSPRVLRAAMGAHFHLDIREGVEAAATLAGYPGQILAADLVDATDLYDIDLGGPVAWLFGSEGQGLSDGVAALATRRIIIPMPGGMESLNVGVAAAVCLFEQLRQGRASGR